MSLSDIQHSIDNALHHTLRISMLAGVPFFKTLDWSILCREEEPFFVTSDDPFVWIGPDMERRFYLMHTPQHISPTGEITVPLSPRRMLILGRHHLGQYTDVKPGVVDELNRRTRAECDKEFVYLSEYDRPQWYDDSKPPCEVLPWICGA